MIESFKSCGTVVEHSAKYIQWLWDQILSMTEPYVGPQASAVSERLVYQPQSEFPPKLSAITGN